jgi:catechol 2,3-dioxygenase-like lactoylglutathione lyase family enzyme
VLEIFEFQPQQPPVTIPWNRVGLTHISFNVRNTQHWYDYLVSKGVECVSRPERSPRGHTFFFARDFDGNLIELMDQTRSAAIFPGRLVAGLLQTIL